MNNAAFDPSDPRHVPVAIENIRLALALATLGDEGKATTEDFRAILGKAADSAVPVMYAGP